MKKAISLLVIFLLANCTKVIVKYVPEPRFIIKPIADYKKYKKCKDLFLKVHKKLHKIQEINYTIYKTTDYKKWYKLLERTIYLKNVYLKKIEIAIEENNKLIHKKTTKGF